MFDSGNKPASVSWLIALSMLGLNTCRTGAKPASTSDQLASAFESKPIDDSGEMDLNDQLSEVLLSLGQTANDPDYQEMLNGFSSPDQKGLSLDSGELPRHLSLTSDHLLKAWSAAGRSVCKIVWPLIKPGGKDFHHLMFFVGSKISGGPVLHGVRGTDFVWDFYNNQFSAFTYNGFEFVFGSGSLGVGGSAYIGLASSSRKSVVDAWSGSFFSGSASISLPFLADLFSLGATAFGAKDTTGNPDLTSVQGASLDANLSLSVPTGAAYSFSIQPDAIWHPDSRANDAIAAKWKKASIPATQNGSETCDGRCLRIDDNRSPGATYRGRALNMLRSIPAMLTSSRQGSTILMTQVSALSLNVLSMAIIRDNAKGLAACSGSKW